MLLLMYIVRQRLRYKQFQLLKLELVEDRRNLEGKKKDVLRLNLVDDRGHLEGEKGEVREFESLKELAAALQKCGVLEWWMRHMFGVYDSGGLKDKEVDLGDMD